MEVLNVDKMKLYLVGGSVRDELMGRAVNDMDYTTNLTYEEILNYCNRNKIKYFVLNEHHYTVTMEMNRKFVEVTPFRKETNFDGRHADCHPVNSLEEDLKRRDFTINAMAKTENEKIIDCFGGQDDIKLKLIRCVGNPHERFKEDFLRIIRGIRFAVVFNFQIEKLTWMAMKENAEFVKTNVSVERFVQETEKIFKSAKTPSKYFELLDELGLLREYFPLLKRIKEELKGKLPKSDFHSEGDTWNHLMDLLDHSKKNVLLRWTILTHDLGKVEEYQDKGTHYSFIGHENREDLIVQFFESLNVSNELIKFCKFVMKNHMRIHHGMKLSKVRKLIIDYGEEYVRKLDEFCKLDKHHVEFNNIFLDQIEESLTIKEVLKPKVCGNYLIELGMKPGKELGAVKKRCMELQLECPLLSREELIKEVINEKNM